MFNLYGILIISIFLIWEKLEKKSKHAKETENVVPMRCNINWDFIDCFSETERNPKVVSGFGNCMYLLGNRTKQEIVYRCEMTNHLALILQNLNTT